MRGGLDLRGRRTKAVLLAVAAAAVVVALFVLSAGGGRSERSQGQSVSPDAARQAEAILRESGAPVPDGLAAQESETYDVQEPLKQAAASLMKKYRERQDCVLLDASYLDLLGNVWGFGVQGAGWADVCILRRTGTKTTQVQVVHLVPQGGS